MSMIEVREHRRERLGIGLPRIMNNNLSIQLIGQAHISTNIMNKAISTRHQTDDIGRLLGSAVYVV